jgi:hypothetical protein
VPLAKPGTLYLTRHNQVDIGFRKLFRVGRTQLSGQADIFNATNENPVLSENTAYGTTLGRPLSILQPRMLRLAAQLRF